MQPIVRLEKKTLPLIHRSHGFDLTLSTIRFVPEGVVFDVIDFREHTVDRYHVNGLPSLTNSLDFSGLPEESIPYNRTRNQYVNVSKTPHVAQYSKHGHLLVSTLFGFYFYLIDTNELTVKIFPDDFIENPMQYSSTGDFSADHHYWYFVRWPFEHTKAYFTGQRVNVDCEVCRLDLISKQIEILYTVPYLPDVHQITISEDSRYAVFTTFKNNPKIAYPDVPIEQDPDGYRRTHEAGIHLEKMVTVNLEKKKHWYTQIPEPIPAHFEFDLSQPNTVYVSAHNFGITKNSIPIIEGPATIFKMNLQDGQNVIVNRYSDECFFRITQHFPFVYEGVEYLCVTNYPNKLDIIDVESMSLVRRREIYPTPDLDFSVTGNVVCKLNPNLCLSIAPSLCGRYIVLESLNSFFVYDFKEDKFLSPPLPTMMEEGWAIGAHSRIMGN